MLLTWKPRRPRSHPCFKFGAEPNDMNCAYVSLLGPLIESKCNTCPRLQSALFHEASVSVMGVAAKMNHIVGMSTTLGCTESFIFRESPSIWSVDQGIEREFCWIRFPRGW